MLKSLYLVKFYQVRSLNRPNCLSQAGKFAQSVIYQLSASRTNSPRILLAHPLLTFTHAYVKQVEYAFTISGYMKAQ